MVEIRRCLDTYALMEIVKENSKFASYLTLDFVITEITLVEFYGVILREFGEEAAGFWYDRLERYALPVERAVLKEAMRFKFTHRKADISFFDAAGYTFSFKHGYLFVTGDKEFERFSGVEFRKK
jgi:predicted nucleic acid-binding protein